MFFLVTRQDTLALHPRDFGKNMKAKIFQHLKQKVEGKASGHFGFTILVTKMASVGPGILNESTGNAHFLVEYFALVFRPFEGEILPAEVKSVTKQGFFAQAAPLEIFVSSHNMPEEFTFDTSTGAPSFVAKDPDAAAVSNTQDNDTNLENAPQEEDIRISVGTMVRVKLIGLRFAADYVVCFSLSLSFFYNNNDTKVVGYKSYFQLQWLVCLYRLLLEPSKKTIWDLFMCDKFKKTRASFFF
ncbi:hypothetical protein RFI_09924 [Reticulomyxa filosa]|uniref:DNA-directed RNA polymerase II subunit RPB7 n=1 Tax=Reticulomyxa filosa TaxID=46433 RepID=X6NMF8_RETFI|nr:hypothetical protein RFI_09924 [Reticulomyxa filosa]|eukprot:ETO27206.1 hypothetical protein RFI_09924 [Reticulomyxa filosa]